MEGLYEWPLDCMWCLMHDLDPQCGTGTAWHPHCGLRWTNLVETCFASMCQQCPLWFESSVVDAQIGPAVAVWRPDLEDFDLNLTVWEAETFVLLCMSALDRFTNRTYACFLLLSELPRLQLIMQPECSTQDLCHMESQTSCSLCVQ